MGFRAGTECRIELIDAARAMCAGMNGVSSAGVVRCVGVSGAAGGYVFDIETGSGASVTASQLQVPQIPCDEMEHAADLAEMWGLGIVAVLGVFLIREFIYRLVQPQ
jgi:hypothetical protein